jgi:hypothetical protein
MLRAGRSWVQFPIKSQIFFQLLDTSSLTMGRISTQPQTEMGIREFLEVRTAADRSVRLTNLAPSVSRLSRNCEGLNISQLYGSPRLVIVIAHLKPLLTEFCLAKLKSLPQSLCP